VCLDLYFIKHHIHTRPCECTLYFLNRDYNVLALKSPTPPVSIEVKFVHNHMNTR